MTLVTSIEHSRRDPAAYLCVVFKIRDQSGKTIYTENTRASHTSSWKMNWVSDDRIRLDSGDIGTHYWNRQTDGTWKIE